jgi:hypothetical protein
MISLTKQLMGKIKDSLLLGLEDGRLGFSTYS